MKKAVTNLLLLFVCCSMLSAVQNPETDSLETLLINAREDTVKVNILLALSKNLFMTDPQDAVRYGSQARELAEKLDFSPGIASAFKFIGLGYYFQGEYFETIQNWQSCLEKFELLEDKLGVANMLNNLGAVYNNEGDDAKALDYYLRSLKVSEEIGDTLRIVTAMINVGLIYSKNPGTYDKALIYYKEVLPICEDLGDLDAIGTASLNLGELYYQREDYDIALSYFEKSLEALSNSGNVFYSLINIGKVYAKRGDYLRAVEYQEEAYIRAERVNAKMDMLRALLGLAETYTQEYNFREALNSYHGAESLAREIKANYELKSAYEGLALSYSNISNFSSAYKYQTLLTSMKDTLYNSAKDKKLQALQFNFDIEKKEGEINLLKKDKALQDVIIQKKNFMKNAFLVGLILILVIAIILIKNNRDKVKANRMLDKQKVKIENLLLNILPSEVAKELQRYGAAVPRYYEQVTVLFTDFKGFTMLAEKLSPKELVSELNDFFIAFDEIIGRHGLEKIKTIGDAYMCAGGIPVMNSDHPFNTVNAGLEMQEYMRETNEKRERLGESTWDLRIGIHTGPVVAGVVGKKKYAYDIWGNTVNIASRMESSGEAGKLNISAATYDIVKESYACSHRGKIYAKNVGDIDMYFVNAEIANTKDKGKVIQSHSNYLASYNKSPKNVIK
jgi:class 3 adenylate cyclase/tetratricopeptide (TPR) repeat protein